MAFLLWWNDVILLLKEVIEVSDEFYVFYRLKPNNIKSESVGTCLLTGVKVTHCGIKCINLTTCTVKIFDVRLS